MANIFDQYGIKEVCDVTFYEKKTVEGVVTEVPVLYLDTLKVSTMEQTAENTAARGGKGNPKLIMWDYNKEINITLEDALFSAKSMAMMFGDKTMSSTASEIEKSVKKDNLVWNSTTATTLDKVKINGVEYTPVANSVSFVLEDGTTTATVTDATKSKIVFAKCKIAAVADKTRVIDINFDKFPGTYKVVGDTYARSATTGEDEFFQLVIEKAKIMSEVTLTMEAEGDPSTFSMNLQVLRPADGKPMVQLIKYDLTPSE